MLNGPFLPGKGRSAFGRAKTGKTGTLRPGNRPFRCFAGRTYRGKSGGKIGKLHGKIL